MVGNLAKIEPAIRALGLGKVQILDAEGRVLRDEVRLPRVAFAAT